MTPAEEQQLHALGNALADAEQSAWQPACVREALLACGLTVGPWHVPDLTLRRWLQLEAVRSPLLGGAWSKCADLRLMEICRALRILLEREVAIHELMASVAPEELGKFIDSLTELVSRAFATVLPMHPPGDSVTPPAHPPGFGWVLALYCELRARGCSRDDALDTPVAEAFALQAMSRWQQGWQITNLGYAQREVLP